MTLFASALAGLLAGSAHTLTGPDHLAAVAPLAVDRPRQRWITGLQWGAGHTLGVALLGGATLWLKSAIEIEITSAYAERLVGLILIILGLWGLRRIAGGVRATKKKRHRHAALGVGTLHGMAGGAHFFGLLPALALPNVEAASAYLLSFGAGTMGAMAGFSTLVGLMAKKDNTLSLGYGGMMRLSSWAAITVGVFWLASV